MPRRRPSSRHQWRCDIANRRIDACVAHAQRSGGAAEQQIERQHAGACIEHFRGNVGIEAILGQTQRIERKCANGVPPIDVGCAIVRHAHRRHDRYGIEDAHFKRRTRRSREIAHSEHLEHDRNASVVDAVGQCVVDRRLTLRGDSATKTVGSAIRIRPILHAEPNGALQLLELASGAATIQIGRIAIVALFASLANAIAANDRLASGIAIHRSRRFALFTARHIDTAVTTRRRRAHARIAKTAHACSAIHRVRPGSTHLAGLSADHDGNTRLGAIACIRIDAIRVGGARELAIGFAAGIGAVARAKVAFFAHFGFAVSTHRSRSLASAVHARVRRDAGGIRTDIRRRTDEFRITRCNLTNRCGRTIHFRINAGTRAIRIATVAILQIAVVADFTRIEKPVATHGGCTNPGFANACGCARHAISKRTTTCVRCIIAFRRHARIEIRAISSGVSGQTRELAIVTAVASDNVAVFAFFCFAHIKIAALVWTANSANADLHIRARRSIGRRHSWTTGMIIAARFFAIAWIRIVAFRVAGRGADIIARIVAIRFATITANHVPVVA